MSAARTSPRFLIFASALIVLQVFIILAAVRVSPDDPFSLLMLMAASMPLLAVAAIISPAALLLTAPLMIMIPWALFTFFAFEWVLFFSLAAALILSTASMRRWPTLSTLEIAWLIYGAWTLVSLSQAADLRTALGGMSRILVSGLAFLAGYRVLGRSRARPLVRVMALLGLAIGLQLIATIVVSGYSMDLVAERVLALTELGWGRSNYVAAVAALAAGCGIALVFFGDWRERLLGTLGILGAVAVQVTTLSRGGAVALLGGFLLAGIIEARRRLLPSILLAAAMVAGYFLSPLGRASVARFTTAEGLPSIGVRLLFFREALTTWQSHWLMGVGPDQIPFHTPLYMDANPHNLFLQHMADLGTVGLLLYLTLLILIARRAMRARRLAQDRHQRLIAMALVLTLGIAVANAQYEPTLGGSVYGFLFWLLAGSLSRHVDEQPAPVTEGDA